MPACESAVSLGQLVLSLDQKFIGDALDGCCFTRQYFFSMAGFKVQWMMA